MKDFSRMACLDGGRSPALRRQCRLFSSVFLLGVLAGGAGVGAAESSPDIHRGATKSEVIKTLGLPSSVAKSGSKEIFTYPQGQLVLENGRVERVEFPQHEPATP